jgi:hypothetical protein
VIAFFCLVARTPIFHDQAQPFKLFDSLIVGYLKLIGRRWRERINSERTYFFALVAAAHHKDAIHAKGKDQEDARSEHIGAKMMHEELASMQASLARLHAKVAAIHKAAGLEAFKETKTST